MERTEQDFPSNWPHSLKLTNAGEQKGALRQKYVIVPLYFPLIHEQAEILPITFFQARKIY